jgi:pimeloyl-ACP methyl ester carboxylesterase
MDVSDTYHYSRFAATHELPLGPGSFFEARKILPLLVEESPKHPSFHVVAISLPGYGFSEAPTKRGFAIDQYAEVCSQV